MSMLQILPFVSTIIDRLIPDKHARDKAKLELEALEQTGELELLAGQLRVNREEAKHKSLFVAGWRPFIGWSCGIIFVYHGIFVHLLESLAAINGVDISGLPKFDTGMFTSVLLGMLGLGGLRTYEKYKGVSK